MGNARVFVFVCAVAIALLAGALHWTTWAVTDKAPVMLLSYVLLFFGCLIAWLSFPYGLRPGWAIGLILVVSLAVRIVITGMPESDDVYRYLWEGKLVAAGESPYRHPAEHPGYTDYRDDYWAQMNHKDKLTAYPPLVQLIFSGVSSMAYTPLAFKAVFIVADLCVIAILLVLLKYFAMDLRNALLYALNPITLFAVAGEGHFDILLVLPMLLSVWCVTRGHLTWAWLWLGIAIQIKIIAIVLLPLYLWRCQWRKSWALLVPVVVPSLYFIQTIPGLLQGIWHFGTENAFNGPIHGPLNYWFESNAIAALGGISAATVCVVIALGGIVLWIIRSVPSFTKAAYGCVAALVLLLPVVHYWYLLWVIPFVVLFPSLSWLVLSLSSGAYFVSVFSVEQGGDWMLPVWAMWVIWLPFLLILTFELRIVLMRKFQPETVWPKPATVSAVVPVLNEEHRIAACLTAIQNMRPRIDEIIVCDGGSNDGTVAVAREQGAQIVTSASGRGVQIAAGVAVARCDVVLVVHADCVCDCAVGGRILHHLEMNPDVVGGAVGQRFMVSNAKLLVIEMLNDARAGLGGAGFGDQGQFFRVAALPQIGGFPAYPLMEDVEMSLRMRAAGRTALLGGGVHNSARQWTNGFASRVRLILKLVLIFQFNRLFRRDVTQALYEQYYNRKP